MAGYALAIELLVVLVETGVIDEETFATVMLTPGGVQGFIGHTLSRNLALGVTVLPKRTTWGVMWSVVL